MSKQLEDAIEALSNIKEERKPPWLDAAIQALQAQVASELPDVYFRSAMVRALLTMRPLGKDYNKQIELMVLHGKALEELAPILLALEDAHHLGFPRASAMMATYLAPGWVDLDEDQRGVQVQAMLAAAVVWLRQWWHARYYAP